MELIKITCNEEQLQELINAFEGTKQIKNGWFQIFKGDGTLFGSWNAKTGNGFIVPEKMGPNGDVK